MQAFEHSRKRLRPRYRIIRGFEHGRLALKLPNNSSGTPPDQTEASFESFCWAFWLCLCARNLLSELALSKVQRLAFGIFADRYGGRKVFLLLALVTMIPAFMISRATTYTELMVWAFLVGIAGNSFSIGIAWNSAWYPRAQQGFALGVFGAGNVGVAR